MPGTVDLKRKESLEQEGDNRDDLSTMDEVRVFKDEGEDENDQDASESLHADLLEEKSSLINESERLLRRPLAEYSKFTNPFGMGYLMNPYGSAYSNIRPPFAHIPGSDRLLTPPPAHMSSSQYERPNVPSPLFPPSPYHPIHPQLSPYGAVGLDQFAAWQASMYRSQYPYAPPLSTALPRFPGSEGLIPPHLIPPHSGQLKPDGTIPGYKHPDELDEASDAKKGPHIKKPLNAFMLYMREMRPVVQAECTLKESAAINQILGRRWHGLKREEQAVYYEKAREERQRHQQLYPNWNARDNYRNSNKPKKRKRDKTDDPTANIKKCRARYGVEQQTLWCKPCRRKKKCIRVQMYLDGHSEQEIEDSCAANRDNDGDNDIPSPSIGSLDGSPQSQPGSEDYNEASLPSPALSIPSLESPSGCGSMGAPGTSAEWKNSFDEYKPAVPSYRPVGSDPRDSSNPLSVSSLTATHWKGEWSGHGND